MALSVLMKILLTGLLVACSAAIAAPLPPDTRVPGGIAVIPLPEYLSENARVRFNDMEVPVMSTGRERVAVVGIPLSREAGEQLLELREASASDTLPFRVESKSYPEQRISLKTQEHVNPSPEQLARYEREAAEQNAVYRRFTPGAKEWPVFSLPGRGPFSSPFGLKRFFNGEPRNPHAGLDIALPEGAPALAPADAVVAGTGDYFFNGRTVMLDHGNGIISMLCHLSKISVVPGQTLKRGEHIGLVGQTGRATGPHLHWTVSINNARIDPLLLVPTP